MDTTLEREIQRSKTLLKALDTPAETSKLIAELRVTLDQQTQCLESREISPEKAAEERTIIYEKCIELLK